MSSIDDSKRLNDDELEAVAGGTTPIDPMLLNAIGHGFPGLNLDPIAADTHTAASTATHIDAGTPTSTGDTHVSIAGESMFADLKPIAAAPVHAPAAPAAAEVVHGTATITVSGAPLAPGVSLAESLAQSAAALASHMPPPVQPPAVMTFASTEGNFTHVTPIVVGQSGSVDPVTAAILGAERAQRGTLAFDTTPKTGS